MKTSFKSSAVGLGCGGSRLLRCAQAAVRAQLTEIPEREIHSLRRPMTAVPRRSMFLISVVSILPSFPALAVDLPVFKVDPSSAPDRSLYDPSDKKLRAAARRLQDALETSDVKQEEETWTEIIDQYSGIDAPWVSDVVGRAWGNRGNARARQGKMQEAIADFNKAAEICPWSVDPVLNRGVVLESLGQFDDAIRDYRSLLEVAPYDPAVWNNLGNAYAGKGLWSQAAEYYGRAGSLAPNFAFAKANKAVAMYQAGDERGSELLIRNLLEKYPDFADMQAALVSLLWNQGREGEAESEWQGVQDPRYSDINWLQKERRWPPKLVAGLADFLQLKSVVK